jgi:serpin B
MPLPPPPPPFFGAEPAPAWTPPWEPARGSSLVRGSNAFALRLFRRVASADASVAIGPTSLRLALTFAWAGARGATAAEIAGVLGLEGDRAAELADAGELVRWLGDPMRVYAAVAVATRLFPDRAFALAPAWIAALDGAVGAAVEALPLRADPGGSRARINAWVEGATRGAVKDLVGPGGVGADTRLVLANAVHLVASWSTPFPVAATRPLPFRAPRGPVDVPTMEQRARHGYARGDGFTAVELAYVAGELSFVAIVPDGPAGLADLEARLDAATLDAWLAPLADHDVSLRLPRVAIAPTESLRLARELGALGMPRAFSPDADFGDVAPPAPDGPLAFEEVWHRAAVRVDEHGTEAAAATALAMAPAGLPPSPVPHVEVAIDRPFFFVVRHRASGLVLFAGHVVDPRA